MRLSCPNCAAAYEVPDGMIAAGGQHVQCTACRTPLVRARRPGPHQGPDRRPDHRAAGELDRPPTAPAPRHGPGRAAARAGPARAPARDAVRHRGGRADAVGRPGPRLPVGKPGCGRRRPRRAGARDPGRARIAPAPEKPSAPQRAPRLSLDAAFAPPLALPKPQPRSRFGLGLLILSLVLAARALALYVYADRIAAKVPATARRSSNPTRTSSTAVAPGSRPRSCR